MRVKNYKQAEELVNRYRSVSLEEIEKVWNEEYHYPAREAAHSLTGFSQTDTCTLCLGARTKSQKHRCELCIYDGFLNCLNDDGESTYQAIKHAGSPISLLVAFKNRADYIVQVLNKKRRKQIV